jgi:hypothetical protein
MGNKSIIRIFSEPKELSIIDRAKYITKKQVLISEYLGKNDWYMFDKTLIDIKNTEEITQLFLKRTKKSIAETTVIRDASDNYIDKAPSIDGY